MSECKCGHDIRDHVIDKAGTNICYCLHNNMDCGCQKYVVKESKKRPDLERPEIEKALQFASTGNKVPLDVTAEIARYALQVEKERDQEKANGDRLAEALEPFTHPDLCKKLAGNVRGDKSPVFGRNNATLYLGDFRKARKALGRRDE